MDFVDLDKVLDEFEEEEIQALSIVPGQELRPSGYMEFLEKHQEQEWALLNPSKFSSTSGYTLERRSAREPANVSYDDPYDSFSTYKLGFLTENQFGSLSQNVYERLPEGKKRRNQSAIVTSLTRISVNDDDVNTVYTTAAKVYERKGIANYSERKGTIAYQTMEVQTDALSPASEQELMSSPFPKSDIIVDGHSDTALICEPTCNRNIGQTYSSEYEELIAANMTNGESETQQSLGSNTGCKNQTLQTTSRIVEVIDPVPNSSVQFDIHPSAIHSCETGTGFPLSEVMNTIANSVVQYNLHSSVSSHFETNSLAEQTIGFHDASDDVLNDTEVDTYLRDLEEQKINASETLVNTSVFTQESQGAQIPNAQNNVNYFKNKQSQRDADEVNLTVTEIDRFTPNLEQLPNKLDSHVVSNGSEEIFYHHNQDKVTDIDHYSQHVNGTHISEKFGHWNNVSNVEPNDRNISHIEPSNRNISHTEPSGSNISHIEASYESISHAEPRGRDFLHAEPSERNFLHAEPSDRNIPYVIPNDKNIPQVKPKERSTSLADHSDRQTLYNSLISGKMEIETILDDLEKIEPVVDNTGENLLSERMDMQNISERLLQRRTEIEGILDEVILEQQSVLEDGFPPSLLAESSDFLNSSSVHVDVNGLDTTDGTTHVTLPPVSNSNPPSPSLSSLGHSPVLSMGVGARPKDPSAIKKNRPNSLQGLSKVSLDLPAAVKPKAIAGMEDASIQKGGVSTGVQFSGAAMQSQQFSSNCLSNSLILDSQIVTEERLRSNSASIVGPEPILHDFSQPFNQSQNGQENKQSLAKIDGLEAVENLRTKRPTSLSLLVEPEFSKGQASEKDIKFEGSSALPGSETERMVEEVTGIESCAKVDDNSMTLQATQCNLGDVAPFWIPDSEAQACMVCQSKFTMWKRRHHCRACGKVLCAICCSRRAVLRYMENREARVCIECHIQLNLVPGAVTNPRCPNSNNPIEYCSKAPLIQQDNSRTCPPVVMVPTGVLKKSGSQKHFGETKQVVFSDEIQPEGGLTELDVSEQARPFQGLTKTTNQLQPSSHAFKVNEDSLARSHNLIPEEGLPPLLLIQNDDGSVERFETLNWFDYMTDYKSVEGPLVVYAVNKNLLVGVKILNLDCCMNRVCWCFVTRGMDIAGQSELVVLLELTEEELVSPTLSPPRNMFVHFQTIYEEALKGSIIQEMGYFVFHHNQEWGNQEYGGFLFLQPTFQCLIKIPLPECPYLFGILIKNLELPWARVFPMRLMLRLGAEYRYYPCPLLSMRNRKSVFFDIGHTIINLLADFRNYQYTLPQIRGVTIHMENKKTVISFPRNRYNDIMKAVHNSSEHVMAMGSSFSSEADSHLVCIQSEDGSYQTQAINIQKRPRLVTGASFVVFNGALKLSSGFRAKSSIVEDGLMVQVLPEVMISIKEALKNMKDYDVQCGSVETAPNEEMVELKWVDNDRNFNIGVKSCIDGTSLEGVEMLNIKSPSDYFGETLAIHWTRVYFLQYHDSASHHFDPMDISRLMEEVAHATCTALVKHLNELKKEGQVKLGLRVNLTRDSIGYEIGSKGQSLPLAMLNNLDTFLVPIVHQASEEGFILEFVFNIFE